MRFLAASLAAVLGVATGTARADPDPDPAPASGGARLHWDEDRPRFRAWEYAATVGVGLAAIAEYTWLPAQRDPHWVGGNPFDDAVHDAFLLKSPDAMRRAVTLADVAGVTGTVVVVGVDSALVPLVRGSFDVAWQLTWMDLESYALGSVVTFTLYDTVGRARPAYPDCQRNPAIPQCNISPTASFPSGHTAEAFLSAGLSCENHATVPIYGAPLADALACARDVTLAVADGTLRMMADRHYATDVLAGAAIGFGFGFGLPALLHPTRRGARRALVLAPMQLGSDGAGMVASGVF